jgi:hypothetical protein
MPVKRCLINLSLVWPVLACSATRSARPPVTPPVPQPSAEEIPQALPQHRGSWTFRYTFGAFGYHILRTAIIHNADSSADSVRVFTNTIRDSLIFEPSDQNTVIKAIVVRAPADQIRSLDSTGISALLLGNVLTMDTTIADSCTPAKSALAADVHNLVVPFPVLLTSGAAWKDSIELRGCQTGVPTLSQVSRSFMVTGDTTYQGSRVIIVTRADSLEMHGEGGLQQHRLALSAAGSGTAVYYLNPDSGQVVRLAVNQDTRFELTTVERRSHFQQTSTQEFVLSP